MSSRERPLEISRDRLVETTLDLVSFDTSNPPGDTREIVDWIESTLTDLGLETERVATDPTKPNLLAALPGKRSTTLLYSGHLDTVPYDPDGWSYDPLGERIDNRLYGRGTTDMKGGVATMLELVRAYVVADRRPPVTLAFAFVSDEEVAGDAGLQAVLDADRLEADACVIGEPTGSADTPSITVADKGSLWLTLEATGESAHGSRPMLGTNAIDALWDALETIRARLVDYPITAPRPVNPILEESIDYYRTSMDDADAARRLFDRPTVNLGTIEGGEAVNSVPRFARAELDVRLPAGVDTEAVLEDVREWLREHAATSIADASWSIGTYEAPESALVDATTAAATAVLDGQIHRRSATGGGDAKRLRNAGIPTVEFAVGTDTVHACDEYTTVDALEATAAVYARLPNALARRDVGE
ncbi:M20 family metallopeptidase [Natronolimnobius sp. AArcel1]|uniref:M20 family metallopeptidase n=1 Tax=Natronolimnobius sp. AArcel1 TaxID=1679093 RepID=UPI0013EC6711|nr:M20/M25/M40 family metallo-hydrolase [Natronolimnobius sp. AArcel1]NGM70531.1 M20 family metallopeptidase [Natronolimnobius sp. AArcel1]